MKLENLQNKNGAALILVGFTTISTDINQWKAGLAYMLVGVALTLIELVFKAKELPTIQSDTPVNDKDTFKTN